MQTNFTSKTQEFGFSKEDHERLFKHTADKQSSPMMKGPLRPSAEYQKATDKAFARRRDADLEELVPKKEGHAKQVEDRRLKAAYTRNEKNPLDFEVSEDVLLGGKDNDYHRLLQAERQRTARKEEERQKRKQERDDEIQAKREKYEQREREVQEMLKKMIKKQ